MTYQHAPRHRVHKYSCSLCGARWYLSRRNSFLLTTCMFFSQIRLQGKFLVFPDFNFDYLWIHVPSSAFIEISRDRSQDTRRFSEVSRDRSQDTRRSSEVSRDRSQDTRRSSDYLWIHVPSSVFCFSEIRRDRSQDTRRFSEIRRDRSQDTRRFSVMFLAYLTTFNSFVRWLITFCFCV